MGSGFYVCARQRTRWPRGSMVCCSKFFRKSHAFELVATDLAGFEPNSRKGVIPVIPISCRMRSSGKKIGKEGHTREIRQPLVLIRFALNLNKENSIVATRERGFESLRPDHSLSAFTGSHYTLRTSSARRSSRAVNDDSQYRPFRETSLWLGHNTDTSWVPEHTTQHQKVQQPQIYKSSKINNFD